MNRNLLMGGVLSLLASGLHLAIIVGGPAWYRFFGAPAHYASEAAQGLWRPVLVTLAIALLLLLWALYAFSAGGLIRRLPLLRPALVVIALVYLVRGMALFPVLILQPELVDAFLVWSSLLCLGFGLLHACGAYQVWERLA